MDNSPQPTLEINEIEKTEPVENPISNDVGTNETANQTSQVNADQSDIRVVIKKIQAACNTRPGAIARFALKPVAIVCATAGAIEGAFQAYDGQKSGNEKDKNNGITTAIGSVVDASTGPYKSVLSGLVNAKRFSDSDDPDIAKKSTGMYQNAALGALGVAIGGSDLGPILTTAASTINDARLAKPETVNQTLNDGIRQSSIDAAGLAAKLASKNIGGLVGSVAETAAEFSAKEYLPEVKIFKNKLPGEKDLTGQTTSPNEEAKSKPSEEVNLPLLTSLAPVNNKTEEKKNRLHL